MAKVELNHVYKRYENGVTAVQDFHLEIKDGEFVIFVGPSGCGKSTTLRMIAGLEEISEGELKIDGVRMNEVEPCDRDIAMVFQNYALYPHMSVYDNIAYSMKLKHMPKAEIRKRVLETAAILDLEGVLKRKPKELSGGQRQRVAMGRAIVRNPKAFLMDEPLSNLDAKLRNQMRKEIHAIYQKLKTTFIYVTHDQTEAMTLGTKIVVLKDGKIQQVATPKELYDHPANLFVASFTGVPQMNFIHGICKKEGNQVFVQVNGQKIQLTKEKQQLLEGMRMLGDEVILGIRPEDIIVSDSAEHESTVEVYELLGADANVYFEFEGTKLSATVKGSTPLIRGSKVQFSFPKEKIHLFNKDSEQAIS